GAGGMSLGAEMAGIRVELAIEANARAAATYARNRDAVTVLVKRIEAVAGAELMRIKRTEPLVVFGGPPCQGFSTSNQRTRTGLNPDHWLFEEYIRVVRQVRPEWVVIE